MTFWKVDLETARELLGEATDSEEKTPKERRAEKNELKALREKYPIRVKVRFVDSDDE